MLPLVVTLLALLGSSRGAGLGVGGRVVGGRVAGGQAVAIESHPYVVNMQYAQWGLLEQACAGALLTSSLVLSAAQCYRETAAAAWWARVGSAARSSGGELLPVAGLTAHEQFDAASLAHDVALVRLATAATLGDTVATAPIASDSYELPAGMPLTVLGWGAEANNFYPSLQLRAAAVAVVSQEACAAAYSQLPALPDLLDSMLCAGAASDLGAGAGACSGDVGAPLVHAADTAVVVGVHSWARGCGDPAHPAVATRVPHYTSWILANA